MELRRETTTANRIRSISSINKAKHRKKTYIHQTRIPLIFTELREDAELCDGTIICDDNIEIKIHRVILAAVSSYFKALFTNTLNPGPSEIIEAKVDVPSHIFRKLLDFAYTGHCSIDEDNVQPLLRAADQYNMLELIPVCCRYIADRLQPTNCLEIVKFARQYFFGDLEKEGRRYVIHKFVKILNDCEEFDNLTITEVIDILEDDELNVKNEELVYNAVRRWINVNPNKRKVHLLQLLRCVRIGRLSSGFLTSNVLSWSLVADDLDCQSYVLRIMNVMNTIRNDADIDNVLWRPRVPYDILFVLGGRRDGIHSSFIETYDLRANLWLSAVDTYYAPRWHHGLCAINWYIYMIGGSDEETILNTVSCFDSVNRKWSECTCMHYPRNHVSVVMHDNKIYALGGCNGRKAMNSAELYDPRYDQWELIKPMQRQRADASAAVLNHKIYIAGGSNENTEVWRSVEVYDTLMNQWTFIPPMLSSRSGASLVAYKNAMYALGGTNGLGQLLATGEKFTPGVSAVWELIKEGRPNCHFATAILDDLIFVLGGSNFFGITIYNPDSNEWMDASPIPMNMHGCGVKACVLSGLPNAKDYSFMGRNKNVGQGTGTYQDVLTD